MSVVFCPPIAQKDLDLFYGVEFQASLESDGAYYRRHRKVVEPQIYEAFTL